jgi:hypothetical protein
MLIVLALDFLKGYPPNFNDYPEIKLIFPSKVPMLKNFFLPQEWRGKSKLERLFLKSFFVAV